MGLWLTVIVIFCLLIVSALLSAAETAVTAASRPRLHRLEQTGNLRARLVNALRERQDRLIGAILLGNNLINILASALATSALIGLFGDEGVVYATVVMTVLIVVFGEVLPKAYALFRPVRTSLVLAPVLRVVIAILSPATHTISMIVRAILRLAGVRVEPGLSAEAIEEELRGSIDLHGQAATGQAMERLMLHGVLDLSDLDVTEVMTHRNDVYSVDAGEPPDELLKKILASPYTRMPVWRDSQDNIVGVLSAKAVFRALHAAGGENGSDVAALAAPPWFIPDSTRLLDQLKAFRERRDHFAIVVDEYGAYQGIVTLEDIVEEIVGDIFDEHETPVMGVRPQADGSFITRGTVAVRDLNRQYNWTLPEDDAATIAGLVIREARVIPEAGQVFEFHGFRFEILRRQRNQIVSLRVTPPAESAFAA